MKLPGILAAGRYRLVAGLMLIGCGQAITAYVIAILIGTAWRSSADPGLITALVIAGCCRFLLSISELALAEQVGQRYISDARSLLFEQVLSTTGQPGALRRAGVTMTRLITDISSLKNWAGRGAARFLSALLSLLGLAIAIHLNWPGVTPVVVAAVLASLLVALSLSPLIVVRIREARRSRGRLSGHIGERLMARLTVRQFNQSGREKRRLRRSSSRLTEAAVRQRIPGSALRMTTELIFPLTVAGLLIAVVWPQTDIRGDLAPVMLILGLMFSSLRDMALSWDGFLAFYVGRERLERLLRQTVDPVPASPLKLPGRGALAVRFRQLTIADRFDDLNARARAGETVLLCGPSGSGKSSLASLLASPCRGYEGSLRLANRESDRLSDHQYHRRVILLSPQLPLLRGSVESNIRYGNSRLEEERLMEICHLVRLTEAELTQPVAELGQGLPDGLRARISLARALVRDPGLLIVDDPAFITDSSAISALRQLSEQSSVTLLLVAPEHLNPLSVTRTWQFREGGIEERLHRDRTSRLHAVS